MPLDITLGDLTWRWQLRDDGAVEDWLSRLPWLGEGGVLVIQSPDDGDVSTDALAREIHAADRRRTEVRVVQLSTGDATVVEVLAHWLNTPQRRPYEVAIALAQDLEVRPALFLLDTRRSGGRSSWADEAAALWDLMSKLELAQRPSVVILHRRGEAPLRARQLLDRGWPVGLARALVEGRDERLWPKYVHLRFAWESGGVVEDGLDCAAISEAHPLQDDADLERVLNAFATAKFLRMSADEQQAWTRFVLAPGDEAVPTVCGHTEELDGRLTPFPWLARALLLRGEVDSSTWRALRADVTCRPIVEQVLNRCFAAEASLRRRLPSSLPEPPADLRMQYERYAAHGGRGDSLIADLYPPGHPAPPRDAWDFASVGVIASHVAEAEGNWRELDRIRLLRNAVAHGHHMGWKGVSEARAIKGVIVGPST